MNKQHRQTIKSNPLTCSIADTEAALWGCDLEAERLPEVDAGRREEVVTPRRTVERAVARTPADTEEEVRAEVTAWRRPVCRRDNMAGVGGVGG
jgi:hypothetical protein